jgi:hypothetical protein
MGARTHFELAQPVLAVVRLLLAKRKLDQLLVAIDRRRERDHVLFHVAKVVARVLVLARAETLRGVRERVLMNTSGAWNIPCSTWTSIYANRA